MEISFKQCEKIVFAALKQPILIITTSDSEAQDIKRRLLKFIHTKDILWYHLSRQSFRDKIYINGFESICMIDYARWVTFKRYPFRGLVLSVNPKCRTIPYSESPVINLEEWLNENI